MTTTIYEVLDSLRQSALDKRDKGDKFERLVKAFLETDPEWVQRFSNVEFFTQWDARAGVRDIGIDLVAKNRYDDGYSAIQCKFYDAGEKVSKADIDSFLSISYRPDYHFTHRYIFDTADAWSGNAEETLKGQVQRIDISWLDGATIDWSKWTFDKPEQVEYTGPKRLLPHQRNALDEVKAGFTQHDRGKLIMACGTGKTFTSLKLAEELVGKGGTVLFLVPSIQLLSQCLREWMAETDVGIRPFAVCSDVRVGRRSNGDDEDLSTVDLSEPPTTDAMKLATRVSDITGALDQMTVVFSTYQSIDVVIDAQKLGLGAFDLVVCDEAHRTAGVILADGRQSPFVKVHDATLLHAKKRLYMTATPKVFDDSVKRKADDADAILFNMDEDSADFGPELHRLGFGEAVDRDLLTDYKVLVLAVDEDYISRHFQQALGSEVPLSEVAKLIGCWNGLAKHFTEQDESIRDWTPMKSAVAFAQTISSSKAASQAFPDVAEYAIEALDENGQRRPLSLEAQHVDGTMGIHERNAKLAWLKAESGDDTCRILTNARCLSEGVDVPALDAVLFLTPRGSQVDVVQSVGRVMRKSKGKELGYIILPVAIPSGVAPEDALKDNERYKVVWQVLQALRSHDDRFNAEVNKIELNKKRPKKIDVITITGPRDDNHVLNGDDSGDGQLTLEFPADEIRDAMYARIVQKVGERQYWAKWAAEVAEIAQAHITRINGLLADPESKQGKEFAKFLDGLRGNLNENITAEEATEMLAQHLITRPIFDALFEGYAFGEHNPVAQVMDRMLSVLDEHNLDAENQTLQSFYASVRRRVEGVDNAEGRQKILVELYDRFFATAFKRTVDKLGVVYTPVEIVDFILRSAEAVLQQEFGQSLSDERVHILDGFAGTGTFLVRLLQSGLIEAEDVARKYASELHGNEILLLAYYIACVNIETTYQGLTGDAKAFEGLILTDTFQSWEPDDRLDLEIFKENNKRLEELKKIPITVILGNPPYSAGQESANDSNANEKYPALDEEIGSTYVARSSSGLSRNMYDSYVRGIKWATLRIKERGIVAYVTNGGFIDSNNADGMRKSLADEFSAIHIFNLRGNQRTAGEQSRREGGKIFGGGSRATVAITVLVKDPTKTGPATIHYTDVGDYFTREEKLAKVAESSSVLDLPSKIITPNKAGDWISQRRDDFATFIPLVAKNGPRIIDQASTGLVTNRDAWNYNFSRTALAHNVQALIATYNSCLGTTPIDNPQRISWSRGLRRRFDANKPLDWDAASVRTGYYRAFTKHRLYFGRDLNESSSRLPGLFPTDEIPNYALAITGIGAFYEFTPLMVGALPDIHAMHSGQVLGRWRFDQVENSGMLDLDGGEVIDGYRKVDNITDEALSTFRAAYPSEPLTKDDIFFYVYGLLHSSEYRQSYAADLKKMLPRIPLVQDFRAFADAGRKLSDLHLNYESVPRHPLTGLDINPPDGADPYEFFAVSNKKISFGGKGKNKDKTILEYNRHITLSGIPEKTYRYTLGARSAIEWLIDRYYIRTDKASGIVNDPNDWSREVGDPRYVIDLFARVTTVSLETMEIVDNLPPLAILD